MKLVLLIVQTKDAKALQKGLVENKFQSTRLTSSGGFLREGNATYMLGVDDDRLEDLFEVVKENCKTRTELINVGSIDMPSQPLEVRVGGAVCFVLEMERMERF